MSNTEQPVVAVLGGTGDLGGGLAWRWAKAGYDLIIGSRTEEKALKAVAELQETHPDAKLRGLENSEAAAAADISVLTVPFAHQRGTLETIKNSLAGKILVDCTVPLVPPKVARVQLPEEGCAALIAQAAVGDEVEVVSAFHNVGAEHLPSDHDIDCDVLVFGDKVAARASVIALIEAASMRGWHAGPLANSAAAEALTSILIGINKRYGIRGSGLRITGEPTKTP